MKLAALIGLVGNSANSVGAVGVKVAGGAGVCWIRLVSRVVGMVFLCHSFSVGLVLCSFLLRHYVLVGYFWRLEYGVVVVG